MLRGCRAGSVLASRRWFGSGASFDVVSPADGATVVATVSADDDVSVATKFCNAVQAERGWRTMPWEDRAALMGTFAERLRDCAGDISRIITSETGKPLTQSRAEVNAAARRGRAMIDLSERARARMESNSVRASSGSVTEKVVHEPVGVVAALTAWNFPSILVSRKLAPALAAGCTVILKAAEETPASAVAMVRILEEAGLPSGVLNLLFGGTDCLAAGLTARAGSAQLSALSRVQRSAQRWDFSPDVAAAEELARQPLVGYALDQELHAAVETVPDLVKLPSRVGATQLLDLLPAELAERYADEARVVRGGIHDEAAAALRHRNRTSRGVESRCRCRFRTAGAEPKRDSSIAPALHACASGHKIDPNS